MSSIYVSKELPSGYAIKENIKLVTCDGQTTTLHSLLKVFNLSLHALYLIIIIEFMLYTVCSYQTLWMTRMSTSFE